MLRSKAMTIGQLSRRTGVPIKALRKYEDLGFLYTLGRSESNYRLFGEEALWCVQVVQGLRSLGLTLKELQVLTTSYLDPDEPVDGLLHEQLAHALARIETHIATLQEIRHRILEFQDALSGRPSRPAASSLIRLLAEDPRRDTEPPPLMSESILTALTTAFSGPEAAFEWKLLHRFWELLVQTGRPISLETLAQALACDRSQVTQVLERYPEAEYDPSGNLVGVGLTLQPTVHQIVLENRIFYTWCAPDAFSLPVMLSRPAQISSRCPVTGTRIEITLTPEHLESFTPASAVVSFARRGDMVKRLKEAGCIRQGGYNNQFFFASQEVAAPWVSQNADFRVFPLEEAFEDLREFAQQQMTLAARA